MLYTYNKISTRFVSTAILAALMMPVSAYALTLGVNAGVSTRETVAETSQRFRSVATSLAKSVGEAVEVVPTVSSDVDAAIQRLELDAMIIHTHAALLDAQKRGWKVRALSQDQRDNQIHFLASKTESAKTLAEFSKKVLVLPGKSSFATISARAEAKALQLPLVTFSERFTAYQDSLAFYLNNGFATIAVTRLSKVAHDWEKDGGRVVHRSKPLPVYALIVNPKLPQATADRLVDALTKLDDPEFSNRSAIDRFIVATEQAIEPLRQFYAVKQ